MDWKDVWSFESGDTVQLAAAQALEASGISLPRGERASVEVKCAAGGGLCFGRSLESDTLTAPYQCSSSGHTFTLPRFFVEAVTFLGGHVTCEGVFRKAGSVARQRALKASIVAGESVPSDANVHDVASLLKQFLRELPDPLLTRHYSAVFEACGSLLPVAGGTRERGVALACLLLPRAHLQCLYVLMQLLGRVCASASSSLMDAGNLAVVMAPNLLPPPPSSGLGVRDTSLKTLTAIAKTLIDGCDLIGRVPPDVAESARQLGGQQVLSTRSLENFLEEGGGASLPQRWDKSKKKERTSSISGLVLGLGSRLRAGWGCSSSSSSSSFASDRGGGGGARQGGTETDTTTKPTFTATPVVMETGSTPQSSRKKRRSILRRRVRTDQSKAKPQQQQQQQQQQAAPPPRPAPTFTPLLPARLDFARQNHPASATTATTGTVTMATAASGTDVTTSNGVAMSGPSMAGFNSAVASATNSIASSTDSSDFAPSNVFLATTTTPDPTDPTTSVSTTHSDAARAKRHPVLARCPPVFPPSLFSCSLGIDLSSLKPAPLPLPHSPPLHPVSNTSSLKPPLAISTKPSSSASSLSSSLEPSKVDSKTVRLNQYLNSGMRNTLTTRTLSSGTSNSKGDDNSINPQSLIVPTPPERCGLKRPSPEPHTVPSPEEVIQGPDCVAVISRETSAKRLRCELTEVKLPDTTTVGGMVKTHTAGRHAVRNSISENMLFPLSSAVAGEGNKVSSSKSNPSFSTPFKGNLLPPLGGSNVRTTSQPRDSFTFSEPKQVNVVAKHRFSFKKSRKSTESDEAMLLENKKKKRTTAHGTGQAPLLDEAFLFTPCSQSPNLLETITSEIASRHRSHTPGVQAPSLNNANESYRRAIKGVGLTTPQLPRPQHLTFDESDDGGTSPQDITNRVAPPKVAECPSVDGVPSMMSGGQLNFNFSSPWSRKEQHNKARMKVNKRAQMYVVSGNKPALTPSLPSHPHKKFRALKRFGGGGGGGGIENKENGTANMEVDSGGVSTVQRGVQIREWVV